MIDILNSIESKDLVKKERISFDKKDLSQMTLPEHARLLNEMQTFIEENEELTDDEIKILDKINLSAEQKVLAWVWVIKQIQGAQEINAHSMKYHEEKIKLLKIRNNTLQNRINNRMDRIDELMILAGKKRIEGANGTANYRKMPEKLKFLKPVEDFDKEKYTGMFKDIPESVEWDKKALLKYAKTIDGKKNDDLQVVREPDKLEIK